MSNTIKMLPAMERPYEKCLTYGPSSLSDAELLAIILKTGAKDKSAIELARELLTRPDGSYGLKALFKHNLSTLMGTEGIGRVKAINLLCVLEISKRLSKTTKNNNEVFDTPDKIADYFMEELRFLEKEQVMLLLLDSKNRRINSCISTMGTINSSLFSTREILVEALKNNAIGIVILHNHPSGDPTPSREDKLATANLKAAAQLVGINVLDHIIIGDKCFFSFNQESLL